MSKTIIISNRLPLQISIDNEDLTVTPSIGGLATGMKSVHKSGESLWIGWSGLTEEEIDDNMKAKVHEASSKEGCVNVPLTAEDMEGYYYGFSNKTIWPLFHYFTEYAEYRNEYWEKYQEVNQKFANVVAEHIEPGDKVWVHDYQLLLLPKLIKERFPDVAIGFFLHIPFPSFEVFRIMPWRTELLEGMLGADLLGFHTYDYERHFFSSVRRLLGHEINFNEIVINNRIIRADIFPMGIDYDKFYNASISQQRKSVKDRTELHQQLDKHQLVNPEVRFILSIDRLDYTKGIRNRLYAFEHFLEKYPKYLGKATLIMLCVPSRQNVDQYQRMKSEIDELVGRINGNYSTVNWTPVWYFYRSMPFENLIDLYSSSDVALLTPIRDGMNLVAKEYVASQIDSKGVLILSEMTGAAKEMSEALLINPNNMDAIADAIDEALSMPDKEQIQRIETMQTRLKRYNIDKWASDFVSSLNETKQRQLHYTTKKLTKKIEKDILDKYQKANKRILFLDYDGTLVGFKDKPSQAKPTADVYQKLDKLAADPKNEVVLVSGRDKETFDKWFSGKNYTLITEHGAWAKEPNGEWVVAQTINTDWKKLLLPILEFYEDRTPGTFLEEKSYSYVWHYRKSDPELGIGRANELKDQLTSLIANHDLEILEGNKVIEVKNSGTNKGKAALRKIGSNSYDFVFGVGDDWTDEYLFKDLPETAVTLKVGGNNTIAKYSIDTYKDVLALLGKLTE
ncbi:MAG: bifunctional alpha,alpha-trehalose-phosphate synthase (UDP-forming)/trehalose-phosphatase [Salinivirgaceae bacterium]|jgi:trehalose 6-phosphate synthase/phosphatase|nr:bifunctional alpha,alpha-trehalose-phosphate synthase (UDP-forming)/trehalose-phosphatase [Salinivirgaceae bacterium]